MSQLASFDRYSATMMAFVPGVVIDGKYRIEGYLGGGGMAAVFRGHDLMLERPVAIKVLYAGDAELLRAEARAMARLRHDNIVQVFSFGVHHDLAFIVMELIEGTNLQETIERQGAIPPLAAIGILEKVAAALDAAHAENIVHRDVKPANVLVGPRYRVCVTDFGLVGMAADPGAICGTPVYMSPEAFFGTAPREEQHLSDQYALGVTAYEMLTGRLPFESDDVRDLMRQHADDIPPPLGKDEVPREVETVVMRALAKSPARRYRSCGAFAEALKHAWNANALSSVRPRASVGILIVDDDPSISRLFSAVIAEAIPEARIAVASDGLIALEIARATPPDLILLDLQMPNLNGMEFLHQLRGEKSLSGTRVIACSGLLGRERSIKGGVHIGVMLRAMGVVEQLGKPVDPQRLVDVVRRVLAMGTPSSAAPATSR